MGKLAAVIVLAAAVPASAETLNIHFGAPGTGPSASYAAAGAAGTWNTVTGVAGNEFPLETVDGQPSSVLMSQTPTTTNLAVTDPSLSGDDARLLDAGLVTTSDETCLSFRNISPGEYEVLIYAWTPNTPGARSRTRQDEAPATKDVGGAWTGAHVEGVTYAKYKVVVDASGLLPAHTGLAPGQPRAVLNGIQIRPLPRSTPDGLSEPGAAARDDQDDPDSMSPTDDGQGGCSAGGGTSGAGVLLVLAMVVGRRGRRVTAPARGPGRS